MRLCFLIQPEIHCLDFEVIFLLKEGEHIHIQELLTFTSCYIDEMICIVNVLICQISIVPLGGGEKKMKHFADTESSRTRQSEEEFLF